MLLHGLRFDKGKSGFSKAIIAVYIFLAGFYAVITALFIVPLCLHFGSGFGAINEVPVLFTFLLMISCAPVLIFGLVALINTLYFARDVEFWAYMPVSSKTVFAAKMTLVYFIELIIAAAIAVPALIAAGVGAGAGPLYYIVAMVGVLAAPLLVLILSAILALPAMYIVSFFKRRGAAASVAVIIIFAILMGLYSAAIGNVQNMGDGEQAINFENWTEVLATAMAGNFGWLRYALLPLYALGNLSMLQGLWGLTGFAAAAVNILLFVGISALIIALAVFISGAIYQKGASSQLEGRGGALKIKSGDKSNSAQGALMKREWREMFRMPAFSLQCILGSVLAPVMGAGMMIMYTYMPMGGGEEAEAIPLIIEQGLPMLMVFYIVMMLGVNVSTGASTIISREGKMFYYAKIIPVDYKTQFVAKTRVWLFLHAASCIVSMLVAVAISPVMWYNFLFMSGFLLIYVFAQIHFAAGYDLANPKLDWTNPTAVVKNSKNVMIPLFAGMGVSTVFFAVFMILYFLIGVTVNAVVASLVSWAVLYAIIIPLAVLFRSRVYKRIDEHYERM